MAADASEQPEGGVLPVGTQVKDQVVQAWLRAVPEGHLYRVVHALSGEHALLQEYFPSDWARREGERVVAQPQRTMDYQVGLKRFLLRVRQLSRLQHPRLPTLLDAWPGQGTAYALLAEPPGRTLADVVQAAGGFLPLDRFWPWLHACMDFAEWLHAQGKVHGAWDPQGIWVLDDDRLVLPPPDVEGGAQPGSPWQALEQTALAPIGTQRGPWTDVFGIAALSAFMLTGQGPMSAARRGVGQRWTPPAKAGERAVSSVEPVPPALMAAIRVSLLPNPRQRPQGIPQLKAMMGLASPGAASGGASSLMPRALPATDPESSGADTVPDTLALEEEDFLPEASATATPASSAPSRPEPVEVPPGAEPGPATGAAPRSDAPEAEAPPATPAAAAAPGDAPVDGSGKTSGDASGDASADAPAPAGAPDETPAEAPAAAAPTPLPAAVEPARKSPAKSARRSRKGPDSRSGEASRPPALGEPSRPSIWSTRATPIDPPSRSRPAPSPVPLAGLAAPTIATEGALVPAVHPRLPVPLGNDSVPTTRPGEGGSTARQQSVRAAAIAAFASAALAAVLFIMEPPRPAELAGAQGTAAAPTPQPITVAEKPVERQLEENPPAAGPAAGEAGVAATGGVSGTGPAPGITGSPAAAPGAVPAGSPAEALARTPAAPATGAAAVAAAPTAEAAASAAVPTSRRDAAATAATATAGAVTTAAGRGGTAGQRLPRCSQALLEHSLGTDATTAGVAQHCR